MRETIREFLGRAGRAARYAYRKAPAGFLILGAWIRRRWEMVAIFGYSLLLVLVITTLLVSLVPCPVVVQDVGVQGLGSDGGFGSEWIDVGLDAAEGALGLFGSSYFVTTTGSDTQPCTSWATACATVDAAIGKTAALHGDTIFVAPGTYDETANGASGVVLDVDGVTLTGVGPGVTIINTNTANDGAAISASADFVVVQRMSVRKGETTSTNGAGIRFFDSAYAGIVEDVVISVGNAASHIGLDVTDGASGVLFRSSAPLRAGTFGVLGAGVGTGVRSDGIQNALGDITVNFFATCVHLTGNARWVQINDDTSLNSCQSQGILVDAGARDNLLDASVLNSPVKIQDNSGNATNSSRASIEALRTTVEHAADPMFPGTLYVVDGVRGKDTNSGLSSLEATRTISHTIGLLEPGDGLVIRADGVYTEDVTIATSAVQIFAAQGVEISGSVRIEADNVWNRRPLAIRNASGVAVYVAPSADDVRLDDVTVMAATTAFDLRGADIVLRNARATGYSVAGYSFAGDSPDVIGAHAGGANTATVGFAISSTVSGGLVQGSSSVGNATAGYIVATGASDNMFIDCSSGSGDGRIGGSTKVDDNLTDMWIDFEDQAEGWHHETVYPVAPGDGTAAALVAVTNTATDDTPVSRDDRYFWGDTISVIPIGQISSPWRDIGYHLSAVTANTTIRGQLLYPVPARSSSRNGGNLGDLGETILTTDGAFTFVVGDWALIVSTSDPQGELVIVDDVTGPVLTISTETRASTNTGLRYNHVGGETIYLVRRDVDNVFVTEFTYSAASAKESRTTLFHIPRLVEAGGGLYVRVQNLDDDGVGDVLYAAKAE